MIQRLRDRARSGSADAGFGMVEVVAAVMIFMILSVGMAYAMVTETRLTSDTRNGQVAAQLATQDIDNVRAVPNPFNVYDKTYTQSVGGTTYTINRVAQWKSTLGVTANCGGGGGNILYKDVQVQVSWPGSQIITRPIQANIALAPQTRLNDPSYGSIIVSVLGADGSGRAGVTVTITPVSGGAAAVGTVPATDQDGCSYVFKVNPGTYTVAVSASNYVDYNQVASPSTSVTVAAGGSQTANFAYDKQATYTPKYASNFSGGSVKLPDSLVTNYLSSKGNYQVTNSAGVVNLFPVTEGYAAIAGSYTSSASTTSGCLSVDPVNWPAGTVNGTNLAAGARQIAAVAPGASGSIPVPMGVVKVTWPGGKAMTATGIGSSPVGTGDPGCAQPTNYTFTYATAPPTGSTVYLALPFGSWQMSALAGVAPATQGEMTLTVVTLDPRSPQ